MTEESRKFIKAITGTVSVVVVAGLYRTGKSYLLNRVMLNQSYGFGVGSTVNACTKGLWMWPQLLPAHDNKKVLVIDTEGLGALDEDNNHDMKIFCLAVLLATTFIYNSVGSIDESALQSLSLVTHLAALVDSNWMRPDLLWIVRDFALELIDQSGHPITSQEYLEFALKADNTHRAPEKAEIRHTIMKAFPKRDCCTLVKPLIDEGRLQRLEEIPIEELRSEFVTQIMHLRKRIFSSVQELQLGGTPVTGTGLAIMVDNYLGSINHGRIPNLADTFTHITQERVRTALDQLERAYTEKIKAKVTSKLPLPSSTLQELLSFLE